jgi:predicted nuclease of restriction endonuclease-like RecB superfamily
MTPTQVGLKHGFRSGLEEAVAEQLAEAGVRFEYENMTLHYTQPEQKRKYTPDFVIDTKSGKMIIVETKGRWFTADRQKMQRVIEQFPDLDIRMVFTRSKTPIRKGSKTTYGDWCQKLGIQFADKVVPQAWLDE